MERRTALEVLGLDDGTDAVLLRRRFRTLARDLHPDRGGDPAAFLRLTAAYELLLDELASGSAPARPARPTVARGRPSRGEDAAAATLRLDDVLLDAHGSLLARRIASEGACRYVSRAPGSALNRIAGSLALGTTSSLSVTLRPTAPPVAHLRLTARGRAARRALSRLDLSEAVGAQWSRRRGDAVTLLEAEMRSPGAHRAAAAIAELLGALRWPLSQWSPER